LLYFLIFFLFLFLFLFCAFCFLLCVLRVFVLFCVLFLNVYIVEHFIYVYNFTDNCHRVDIQLQGINIISSYHTIPYHIISYHIISYHIISECFDCPVSIIAPFHHNHSPFICHRHNSTILASNNVVKYTLPSSSLRHLISETDGPSGAACFHRGCPWDNLKIKHTKITHRVG
jgi:hypothetical protein